MNIEINNREMRFGDQRLVYDLYHLDYPHYEKYRAETVGGVFKNIVIDWVKVLKSQTDDGPPLFLPFAFDDEWIDCLKAIQHNGKVTLSRVRVAENGWAVDFGALELFMSSPHEIETEMVN